MMLKPFDGKNSSSNTNSLPLLSHSQLTKQWTYRKLFFLIIAINIGVGIHVAMVNDSIINGRSLLCVQGGLTSRLGMARRILCSIETELETTSFRETFESSGATTHTADNTTVRPSGTVAFVVTISSCDEEPRDAFYDAAAVLKTSVCNCTSNNPDSGSQYESTLYAIIHPSAIECEGPASTTTTSTTRRRLEDTYTYDRVAVLEELGFWVIIWGEPVSTKRSN